MATLGMALGAILLILLSVVRCLILSTCVQAEDMCQGSFGCCQPRLRDNSKASVALRTFNFLAMLIQVLFVTVEVSLFPTVERQLQQTSLKEWVTRKKSSGSTGTPDVSVVYTKWL